MNNDCSLKEVIRQLRWELADAGMLGVLDLDVIIQDGKPKIILGSNLDILISQTDDQILEILRFASDLAKRYESSKWPISI